MSFIDNFKNSLIECKHKLMDYSFGSIIWLLNLAPSTAGFSILDNEFRPLFWIAYYSLITYVYGVGSIMYQIKVADSAFEFIKSNVNVTLYILFLNVGHWFITKRGILNKVIEKVNKNDKLSRETDFLRDKHTKMLWVIKKIIFIFYGCNLIQIITIYLPQRTDLSNKYYSTIACVGIEPLNVSPKREICKTILLFTEFSISTACLNYQALLFFLIAHTAAMYRMLSEEFLAFDKYEDSVESNISINKRLPFLIGRHALTLDIINDLKQLYSMPTGVNFGLNAICICLFFYLPLHDWVTFFPVLTYCFCVFFLYCFLCQTLINASEEFENAVYGCGWEKFNVKEKKTAYVILLQAQKPVEILAADIVPINIYTFATTLQAMFKFITVFKI